MEELELRKLQVEAWKTTIEVQQHFNDIEMRIRALAITLLTAVLGAAAVAVRNRTTLHVFGAGLDLGGALVVIGLLAWILFYFADEWWYHRLLKGAVDHGRKLETVLHDGGVPGFGLTTAIGDASAFTFGKRKVRSTHKIRIFYFVIAGILVVLAIVLFANRATQSTPTSGTHPHAATTTVKSP